MSHITKSLKGLTLIAFVFLIQANVFGQTVYDFPYTGTYSTVTLQPGNYKLEVWGAEGGINTTNGSSVSGKGGYSKGTLNLNASTIAYIFVGGKGIDSNTSADQNDDLRAGGFNGGGSGIDGGAGGGGASDIRLLANTVYDRVIVAGGAGGVGYNSGQYPGGYGGGESGGGVTSYSSLAGATQTTGHALGQGQDHQSPVNKNDSGGGGGGFYGGFGGGPHNTPGTGGSGYVYTLTSEKPGGYNLGSQYYLTNTSLIAGNASMPNPDGGANTIGRSGNGYARITQLSSGGTISSATSVFCTSSTDPDAFTSTAAANGGSGAFSYQWQVSTDGTNYNDISGATSLTYDPGVISQTTYYRRKATNNLTLYSNVLTLEKFEIDTHPSITDQTLATGANSTDLGVVVSNISDVSYQWYRNASNSNTGGTSISGANSDTFTPPTDTVSKWYYYVVVTKGGCSITSNVSGAVTVGRGMGNLTIVESGGDNIGTNWIYDNGVLTTTNSTATVNASVVEGYLLTSDLSVEAANITIDTDLTSTSANNLTLKSKANISQNTGTSVTTNNGNVILWADSDANNEGYIELGNNATINTANGSTTSGLTGGGHIVLSGGADDGANEGTANDGIPDGYASNSTGVGVNLGTTNANTTQMYSGGGDIIIRGKSTKTGGSNVDNIGLFQYGILNANSGTGSIVLFGSSTAFYGINFTEPVTNQPIGTKQLTLSSAKTSGDAIVINGTSGTNYGVVFNYENPKELLATGGGNISISGTAGGNYGIFLQNQDILASGGTVTLDGGSKGIRSTQYGARFGARSGTGITSSTANIRILGDILTFDALASGFTHTVSTTGTLTIQPSGNSFSSALSWPITNFNVNSGITGLTIGKPTNSSNVTIASAQSVAGSITLYGGDLVINESITATAEGADILLKGSADIVVAGSKSLITNGGDVIFWADSDGDGDGYINIDGDIATNGGGVWIGGSYGSNSTGSDSWIPAVGASPVTVGDGYAVTDGGNNIFGVLLDTNSSINSGGGNISIFGYGDQYYDAGSHRYSGGITLSGSIINSGIGSIFIEGEVKPDEPLGADVEWASGVMIHSNSSITSSTGSITLSGSSNLNDYQYVAGLWLGSILWNNSATGDVTISSNSGNILLDGVSKYNVSRNSFRHGLVLKTTGNIGDNISISTNSGSVNLNGETGYAGENKYNKGLYLSSNDTDSKIAITSQSGVINLKGINNGNDGANQVAVEFEAGNAPNQIRIGYDGTNAYTGNIRIQGNSLKQTTSLSSEGSISLQTTGNLTIEPVGNSFTMLNLAGTDGALTFDNDWNFSSTLSGLTIGKSTNTSDVTIGSAIDISGPITVYGSNIAINEDLDTQNGSANGDISLKASNNIVLAANKSITTDGGDVMFWSDSDASGTTTTAGGTIALLDASSINTAGGNITLAGGSDDGGALAGLSGLTASDGIPDGYAIGAYGMTAHGAVNATAGLTLDKAIINAGTGNVILRGQGTGNATNFQMGTRLYGGSITAKDISIDAIGSIQGSSSSSWGLSLEGFSLQGSGNIKLSGKGGRAGVSNSDSNQAGVEIRAAMDNTTQHAQVRATGNGTILIKGTGGSGSLSTSNNLQATGIRILSGQTNPILSESGSITLEGTSGYSGGGPGILIQSPISSTNGAINLKANPSTEGTLNQNGNIEIQSTVTTGGNLTVESLGAVTQTAAITANGLGLNGTGNFTLTNASNNVTTIAGGDNSTRLGSLRFTDATGGLTVGSVNPTGINSSGAIEIATISGDLLVTEPIVSTLSTGDAVKLYADKDAAAGELGDGQIKMSLNGVVTVESGARALLYSGKELESTGVKTALGGEANIRYEVDANTNLSTLDPAISATGSFGLFRIDNLIDLTVTSQDLVVTKLYDGTNTTSVTNVIVSGVESGDEVTVSGTATYDNTNVGSGKTITVIYTLSGNDANKYRAIPNFTTNTGEITQKAIEITAASDIKVFDGVALTKNNSSISGGSLVNSQTYTVTLTGSQTNVGSSNNVASNAVIKDSSDNDVTANYNITYVNGSLEVTKLDITIIPTASQSKTYGEVNTPLTYTINPSTLPNGTTITLGGTLSRTLGENVGTYSITLGTVSNTNYNITLSPETFAINKKTITVSGITAGDKVY
ncbi:glycine-rich protein, partial [Flavobacteriaceae bacterium LSUCC0859]|nr:glycine-rich protein [Flavobacteriaceae bacterium LSUCC0859]